VRVLIVEDDRKLAEFVMRGLRAERFAVDHAADGREGHGFLNTYPYDLLILDLIAPIAADPGAHGARRYGGQGPAVRGRCG